MMNTNMKPGIEKKGITLVEVLVSLALVLMVVIFVTRMISAAFDSYRNSNEAIRMHQRMDDFRGRLLSEEFDSERWQSGNYKLEDRWFIVNWSIHDVSPTLKVVHYSFKHKTNGIIRRSSFYKSLHIRAGW